MRRFPVKVTLRLGIAPGIAEPVIVDASINGVSLDSRTFSRAQISEWVVTVPSRIFQNGKNTLALKLTTSERDADNRTLINCHSISTEPLLALSLAGDGNP